MKKISVLILLFISVGFTQQNFTLSTTIVVGTDFFTTDNQSNIYVVKGDELKKYNKAGELLYKYSNKNFGTIDFVDASNMMRLLVFYKNFLQVVFLDNTLTLTGKPISLDEMNLQQSQLTCSSYDNGFWIYDQQNMELVRMDKSLKKAQQTGNLNTLLNINLQPNYLLEYNNKVYLNNPSTGILIFDIYGTYYKTVPLKSLDHFQPINDWIYFSGDNKIHAQHTKTTELKEFDIPAVNFDDFRLENGVLILQNKDTINVYSN